MPMTDVYAAAGTCSDIRQLAKDRAATLMAVEGVPNIPMFRKNTTAFVHELPSSSLADVDSDSTDVRGSGSYECGALDRDKQLAAVRHPMDPIATAAGHSSLIERTWVLLTEASEGGWGSCHAHFNEELATAARAEITKLQA